MVHFYLPLKRSRTLEKADQVLQRCWGLTHDASHLRLLPAAAQELYDVVASLNSYPKDASKTVLLVAKQILKVLQYHDEELMLSESQIKQVSDLEHTIEGLRTLFYQYGRCLLPNNSYKKQYTVKHYELQAQLEHQCKKLRDKATHTVSDRTVSMIGIFCGAAGDAISNTPAAPLKALANVVASACAATVTYRQNQELADELSSMCSSIQHNIVDASTDSLPDNFYIDGPGVNLLSVFADVYRFVKQLEKRKSRNPLKRLLCVEGDKQHLQALRSRLVASEQEFATIMIIQTHSEVQRASKTNQENQENIINAVNALEVKIDIIKETTSAKLDLALDMRFSNNSWQSPSTKFAGVVVSACFLSIPRG